MKSVTTGLRVSTPSLKSTFRRQHTRSPGENLGDAPPLPSHVVTLVHAAGDALPTGAATYLAMLSAAVEFEPMRVEP